MKELFNYNRLPRKKKKILKKIYRFNMSKYNWHLYYENHFHKERVWVKCMNTIGEDIVEWYKIFYPEDKLKNHYAREIKLKLND